MKALSLQLSLQILLTLLLTMQVYAQVLKGGIEFSDKLPPVRKSLSIGTTFDEKNLPDTKDSGEWYRIPGWIAGVWHRNEQITNMSLGRKLSIPDEVDEHFGYQKDKKGEIWNYHNEPYVERHETDKTIEVKLVTLRRPIKCNDRLAVFYYQCTSMTVSKENNKIISEYQQEEFDTFKKIDANTIRCDCKARMFSAEGKAERFVEGHYSAKSKAGFAPIDRLSDKDLRKDFNAYLSNQGLKDLIP